jgi:hypothetical protein
LEFSVKSLSINLAKKTTSPKREKTNVNQVIITKETPNITSRTRTSFLLLFIAISTLFHSLARTPSSAIEKNSDDLNNSLRERCTSLSTLRGHELTLLDIQLRQLLTDNVQGQFVRHVLVNTLRTHTSHRPLVLHFVGPSSLHAIMFSIVRYVARVLHAITPEITVLNGTDSLQSFQRVLYSLNVPCARTVFVIDISNGLTETNRDWLESAFDDTMPQVPLFDDKQIVSTRHILFVLLTLFNAEDNNNIKRLVEQTLRTVDANNVSTANAQLIYRLFQHYQNTSLWSWTHRFSQRITQTLVFF